MQHLLRFQYGGRCLVLLAVYMLGMLLGSAVMLGYGRGGGGGAALEPVRTSRRDLPPSSLQRVPDSGHISLHRKQLHTLSFDETETYLDSGFNKSPLFVAVLPLNYSDLDQISSIYNTWSELVQNMAIFLPNTTNQTEFYEDDTFVPILDVDSTPTDLYPSINEAFEILRYLYNHHLNQYQYFLLVSDRAYVNPYAFQDMANEINPDGLVYTGLPVQFGWTQYCLGDTGVLLNDRTLATLVSNWAQCGQWKRQFSWDRMLGRCISELLDINCTSVSGENKYFIQDSSLQSMSPGILWRPDSSFVSAFSVSPVNTNNHMNILHYYYIAMEMKRHMARVEQLRKSLLSSCDMLESYAFEHETVKKDCEKLVSENADQDKAPVMLSYFPLRKAKKKRQWKRRYHQPPSWKYFDEKLIYADNTIEPCVTMSSDVQLETDIHQMAALAEVVVQERRGTPDVRLQSLVNGYVRQDVFRGNEYIMDAVFNDSRGVMFNERVRLVRPFLPSVRVELAKSWLKETVHVIVPVSNANEKCFKFLQFYVSKSLKQLTRLLLIVYRKIDYEQVEAKVMSLVRKHPEARISVIKGKGRFSRSKALHQGMASLKDTDLAFFCDVDMVVQPHFYDRCRRNTVRGEVVYFPAVVKLYNPKFIKFKRPFKLPLNRHTGHWAAYGYGMACIYKSDYIFAGGLNIRMRGWGGEDVEFYKRITQKGLTVFRAPDKGLVHHWHERDCSSRFVRRSMQESCYSSKIEALGDKRTLAKFIFNVTERYPDLIRTML